MRIIEVERCGLGTCPKYVYDICDGLMPMCGIDGSIIKLNDVELFPKCCKLKEVRT